MENILKKGRMFCKVCGKKVRKHTSLMCNSCLGKHLGLSCEVCGDTENIKSTSKNNKYNMILCGKHFWQMQTHGKINDMNKFQPNEFILYENEGYAEIVIRNHPKAGEPTIEVARAIIDIEDVEKCKQYKWHSSKGYPATCIRVNNIKNYKNMYLHNFVTNCPKDLFINHRDFNPMNARKYNLQICTHEENSKYKNVYKSNSSGVNGFREYIDKYTIETHYKRKYRYFGTFKDKIEAIFTIFAIEIINSREFTNLHKLIKTCKDYSIDFNEILCFLNDMKYDLSFLSNEFVVRDLEHYNIKVNLKPCTFEIKTCSLDLREIDLVTR